MTARIVYACDGPGCREELDTETERFAEATKELREAGWRTVKAGDVWEHYCDDCRPRGHWERD